MLTDEDRALYAGLDAEGRRRNGIPDEATAARRAAGADAVRERLPDAALRVSPLGAGWSSDVDVHLASPLDPATPQSWGWLPLDRLLERIGSDGGGRWAVHDGGEVVASVDLQSGPVPDRVAGVLSRCRRRGEVRLREVLELRALLREGSRLPADDAVARLAADVEAGAGGSMLREWGSGQPAAAPAPVRRGAVRTAKRAARTVVGPRVVVAVSGVDGAGKSTITHGLLRDLTAAGVPVSVVWTRPGMGLGWLGRVAGLVKGATGQAPEPGVRAMAAGDLPPPRSRQGVVGVLWTVLVTLSFLVAVRRQHASRRGVLIYDRHLLDALATLRVLYRGVPQGVPTWLVHRLLPRAHVTLYLDVSAETAAARKPGDTIGAYAVAAQLAEYSTLLPLARGLRVLDATRPRPDLQQEALAHVLSRV